MQKDDFLKSLLEKAVPNKMCTLLDAMQSLDTSMSHKPPSIFKCQMSLFDQWFSDWSDKDRNDFMIALECIDSEFVTRFNAQVAGTSGQP